MVLIIVLSYLVEIYLKYILPLREWQECVCVWGGGGGGGGRVLSQDPTFKSVARTLWFLLQILPLSTGGKSIWILALDLPI